MKKLVGSNGLFNATFGAGSRFRRLMYTVSSSSFKYSSESSKASRIILGGEKMTPDSDVSVLL